METTGSRRAGQSSGPRACANCAHAKAKCIAAQDLEAKCQRCSRLEKECSFPAPPVRKRRPTKRTRVAEMEAKIDGLVTLLKSTQNPSLTNELLPNLAVIPHAPPTPSSPDGLHPPFPSYQPGVRETLSSVVPPLSQDSYGPKPLLNSDTYRAPSIHPSFGTGPSPGEAEIRLSRFRQMLPYFPFMHLSTSTSAADLLEDRPFLYHCIMSITCRSPSLQSAFGEVMMRYLGEQMLVQGVKTLDLLLGILAYAGWYHFDLPFTSRLCVLLQLAITLVFNLGLNRPLLAKSRHQVLEQAILNPYDNMKTLYEGAIEEEWHTKEEQRSLVGCFFLSSVISTYFQRMDPLRLTPYLEDCIRNLGENAEYQSDIVLSSLARHQIIVAHIPSHLGAKGPSNSAPAGLYVKALQAQLHDVRNEYPNDRSQHVVLMLYHSVEMSILELGFSMPTSVASGNDHGFQRLETLHACLRAAQAFFETFLSQPVHLARSLSFFTYTQIAFAMVMVHKLSTFESKDWDLDYVRGTLDFGSILEKLIDWFSSVAAAEGTEGCNKPEVDDIFIRTGRKLGRIKAWHDQRAASSSLTSAGASSTMLDADVAMDGVSMDFFNEEWLEQMMGPWSYPYNAGLA